MKKNGYYIIKESELSTEVFEGGYTRTKDGVIYQIVPFTNNETLKKEYIYTLTEWSNFGFDEIKINL